MSESKAPYDDEVARLNAEIARLQLDSKMQIEIIKDLVAQGCSIAMDEDFNRFNPIELETSCISAYEWALEYLEKLGIVRALIPGRRYVWVKGGGEK